MHVLRQRIRRQSVSAEHFIGGPGQGAEGGLNESSPLAEGLVAWFPLTDGRGRTAVDLGPHRNHGELDTYNQTPTLIPSWQATAEAGQHVKMGDSHGWSATIQTIDYQPLLTATGRNEATLTAWLRNLDAGSMNNLVGFRATSSNQTHYPFGSNLYLSTFSAFRRINNFGDSAFDKTRWHFICLSTKPGANGYRFRRNGLLVAAGTGDSVLPTSHQMRDIGAYSAAEGHFCAVKHVRLYDRFFDDEMAERAYVEDDLWQPPGKTIYSFATGGPAPVEASLSLGLRSDVGLASNADGESSLSLGANVALGTAASAALTAALDLAESLGLTGAVTADLEAALTTGSRHAISATTGSLIAASISLGMSMVTISSALAELQVSVPISLQQSIGSAAARATIATLTLGHVQGLSAAPTAAFTATLVLGQSQSIQTGTGNFIVAQLALALRQSIATQAQLDVDAQLPLGMQADLAADPQADLLASTGLGLSAGLSMIGQAVLEAGLTLDAIEDVTVTPTGLTASLVSRKSRTFTVAVRSRTKTVN